jgi:DNA-binding transcriptional regulator YbjK
MNENDVYRRIERLFTEIHSEQVKTWARKTGDVSSWTRSRDMPLHDILTCTLAKKDLSTTMEIRQYFQTAGKAEQTVSKQDYLKQRQKLNPEVFKILNRNYLKRFYGGQEAKMWCGYLLTAVDGSRRTKVRRKYLTAGRTGGSMGKA